MSDSIEVMGVAGCLQNPTRYDCEVAASICRPNVYTRYYRIIRLLMLAGFAVCICTVPLAAQDFTVEVIPQPQQFTVAVQESVKPAVPQSEFYVVMYSGDSCPPCRYYKSSGQLAKLEAMLPVKVINTDIDRKWYSGRIPCFWLCRRQGSVAVHKWNPGAVSPETIAAKIKEIERRTTTDPTEVNSLPEGFYDSSIYNGQPGSSHENRSSLIKHLYNDGIHKGLREMAELNAMSDSGLDAAHDQDHRTGK